MQWAAARQAEMNLMYQLVLEGLLPVRNRRAQTNVGSLDDSAMLVSVRLCTQDVRTDHGDDLRIETFQPPSSVGILCFSEKEQLYLLL